MKSILSTNPTFTPGAANVGTLNFSSVNGFNIAGLLAVLNQTRGTLLYATGKLERGYASWNNSTKVLTLKVDTTGHSSGDQLQVIYDGPGSNEAALTSVISGGATDSVITSSPAILLGYHAGGIVTGAAAAADLPYYQFTIKNGSSVIINGVSFVNYPTHGLNQLSSGINCPNGITVTVAKSYTDDEAVELANARFTIFYILK